MTPSEVNKSNVNDFLNSFDYVLTDCDGVLWRGNNPIPGSPETINFLRRQGKKVIFITNNSSKTRKDYMDKCHKLGIEASLDEIYPTSYCTASYLKSHHYNKKAFLIGSSGLVEELAKVGIESLPIGPDLVPEEGHLKAAADIKLDKDVGAVIVGFDCHVSFLKLIKACSYLRNPECLFIATNLDTSYPDERQDLTYPGTGSIVKAVETATGRTPTVIGKPMPFLFSCIQQDHPDLRPDRAIIFGDWVRSDILLGKTVGLTTALVMTGVTTKEELDRLAASASPDDQRLVPHFVLPSLGHLTACAAP